MVKRCKEKKKKTVINDEKRGGKGLKIINTSYIKHINRHGAEGKIVLIGVREILK